MASCFHVTPMQNYYGDSETTQQKNIRDHAQNILAYADLSMRVAKTVFFATTFFAIYSGGFFGVAVSALSIYAAVNLLSAEKIMQKVRTDMKKPENWQGVWEEFPGTSEENMNNTLYVLKAMEKNLFNHVEENLANYFSRSVTFYQNMQTIF